MRRLLIVSGLYPPINHVGALRPYFFSKHLPESGWRPTVLSARISEKFDMVDQRYSPDNISIIRACYPRVFEEGKKLLRIGDDETIDFELNLEDYALSDENRSHGKLVTLLAKLTINWIAFPNTWNTWYPFAILSGLKELKRIKYSAIYSKLGPANHIVAHYLKRMSGLPWIADYDDPWTQKWAVKRSPRRMKYEEKIEKAIIKEADWLISITKPLADLMLETHPDWKGQLSIIPNGFDHEEYPRTAKGTEDKFVLTFAGDLYGMKRDMRPLIEVLTRIIERGVISENEVVVRVFGAHTQELRDICSKNAYSSMYEINDSIPRVQALEKQQQSTVLLHLMLDSDWDHVCYGSKIFEYLASGRPVLVWSPRGGPIKSILDETGGGEMATNKQELEAILLKWIDEYKRKGHVSVELDKNALEKYSYRNLTKELVAILDQLVGG